MTVRLLFASLYLVALSCKTAPTEGPLHPTVAAIPSLGPLNGNLGPGFESYLGIPYAEPPVGPLRFTAPRPHPGWSTPVGQVPGSACVQRAGQPIGTRGSDQEGDAQLVVGSEDCLYLNIWIPSREQSVDGGPRQNLPVMVWFHGGGFSSGSGIGLTECGPEDMRATCSLYDGGALAARFGVIVVTLNYRLAHLGFLAHPALADGRGDFGSYGILDQQTALRWVQDHIATFGGDSDNVTIFGESAGAMSVLVHLASPGSSGLFHRAIAESPYFPRLNLAESVTIAEVAAATLGCAGSPEQTARCLRETPAAEFAQLHKAFANDALLPQLTSTPVIGNSILPDRPLVRIATGTHNAVPIIVGSNSREIVATLAGQSRLTEAQSSWRRGDFRAALIDAYGLVSGQTLYDLYRPSLIGRNTQAQVAAFRTDFSFSCYVRQLSRSLSRSQDAPVFRYVFARSPAFHGLELPYVFQLLDQRRSTGTPLRETQDRRLLSRDRALSRDIGLHWTAFATSADPNAPGAPHWPAYDPAADNYRSLSTGAPTDAVGFRPEACAVFDELFPPEALDRD